MILSIEKSHSSKSHNSQTTESNTSQSIQKHATRQRKQNNSFTKLMIIMTLIMFLGELFPARVSAAQKKKMSMKRKPKKKVGGSSTFIDKNGDDSDYALWVTEIWCGHKILC